MLPTTSDHGARLAAVLPTCLLSLSDSRPNGLPAAASAVVIVVDGLGWANLRARRGHARTLAGLSSRRIETVTPSTTGAALTTITTGRLPGEHGLVGYKLWNPATGRLHVTLSDWDGTDASWQRGEPLFVAAGRTGIRSATVGRPAHAAGGLTAAILRGADYLSGQTIRDRFAAARRRLAEGPRQLVYVYVDELDRAGHQEGWESAAWTSRLEQFDDALGEFLRDLPADVGVAITADHGMVDVPPHRHLRYAETPGLLDGVRTVGGEPRFRYLYLDGAADAAERAERADALADRWREAEGERAWVATRAEAIDAGLFGPLAPGVAERIGDVIVAARKAVAYYGAGPEEEAARGMVGQHGSLTDEERGVPLILGGRFRDAQFPLTAS